MGKANQFLLLQWKNWRLQSRKPIATVLEFLLPLMLVAILVGLRQLVEPITYEEPTTWEGFETEEFVPELIPYSQRLNIIGDLPNSGFTLPPDFTYTRFSSPGVNPTLDPNVSLPVGNITIGKWEVCYTPVNPVVRMIMEDVSRRLDVRLVGFETEIDLLNYTQSSEVSIDFLMAVVFNSNFDPDNLTLSNLIDYTIRPKSQQYFERSSSLRFYASSEWLTDLLFPLYPGLGPRYQDDIYGGKPGYYKEGFLPLQRQIDKAIIRYLSKSPEVDSVDLVMKRQPYPPYLYDVYVYVLEADLALVIILSFLMVAPNISKDVTLEKERKLRELMQLMGLSVTKNWISWFIKYLVMVIVICLLMTFLLHLDVGVGPTLPFSDPSVTFMFLLLFSIAMIMFCFMVSSFFSKASSAAAACAIFYLLTYVPYSFMQLPGRFETLSLAHKLGMSLFLTTGLCLGAFEVAKFETAGVGLTWSNLNDPLTVDDQYTMAHCFTMFVVDSVVFGIIAWYVDAIMPREYGVPLPWYFPFTKSYWCGVDKSKIHDMSSDVEDVELGDENQRSMFERSFSNNNLGMKIHKLGKVFTQNGEKKVAVGGISLDIYEGQITALLGHNGAGKTTTIFMITGFIAPSSGTAYINGYDIRTDITGVRESLGLCPQHDVLFDTLTVKEHLQFFAKLKGCDTAAVETEVNNMIKLLHLDSKRNTKANSLSGGMKRKLCVGIALIAGSKTVVLDEPTSGMDPEARRQMWDILQSQKAGRTMILTTHFMDEADYLGDRIAIMADGHIKCCGSSWFLKSKYGVGYHLVMVKAPHCKVDHVTSLINSYVPEAMLESNMAAELSYVLPKESSANFEKLFTDLEANKEHLGLRSFGASVTTMEEVFLKVGEESDDQLAGRLNQDLPSTSDLVKLAETVLTNGVHVSNTYENLAFGHTLAEGLEKNPVNGVHPLNNGTTANGCHGYSANGSTVQIGSTLPNGSTFQNGTAVTSNGSDENDKGLTPAFGAYFKRVGGLRLHVNQFNALLIKRVIHSYRNRLVSVVQLLVPLIFAILSCVIVATVPGPRNPPPRQLGIWQLSEPAAPYSILYDPNNSTLNNLTIMSQAYVNFLSKNASVTFVNDEPGDVNMTSYLVYRAEEDFLSYRQDYQIAATFVGVNESNITVVSHFNNEGYHSAGMSLSAVSNTLLWYFGLDEYEIRTTNHPLPRDQTSVIAEEINTGAALATLYVFNTFCGICFLVGSFVIFLINERVSKSKHIQFVSGVHAANYWISTFVWDLVNYIIPIILVIFIFFLFNVDPYSKGINSLVTFYLFLMYAWAVVPMMYLLAFAFDVPSTGYVWASLINILSGTIAIIVVGVLLIPDLGHVDVGQTLDKVFRVLIPNYTLLIGMQLIYENHEALKYCGAVTPRQLEVTCLRLQVQNITNPCCPGNCGFNCATYQEKYLAWDNPGIGSHVTFLALQGAVAFFFIFLLESGFVSRLSQVLEKCLSSRDISSEDVQLQVLDSGDEDVRAERERVKQADRSQTGDTFVLVDLKKVYNGGFYAVRGLTLGVSMGECFGLLGVNGAGKTSTFKMMTGDEPLSGGTAYLGGFCVIDQIKQVRQNLGYCPQFDALIEQMTVKETLAMYARLRGVSSDDLPTVVDSLIDAALLREYENKQAGTLSGGNKRKLSTAIALVGDPPVVFLDEPTTGMDPVARRLLWRALTKFRDSGRTLILTSHSMEECEALCTRLAIMVNGQFQCLGTTQHLKTTYGDGFTIIAKLKNNPDVELVREKTQNLQTYLEHTFKNCSLKDFHTGYLNYQIPTSPDVTWAKLFAVMETLKDRFDIEDYSVSQTNLEQIFLQFARNQIPPREKEKRKCCACSCWPRRRKCKVGCEEDECTTL